jgi:hypothetical protein
MAPGCDLAGSLMRSEHGLDLAAHARSCEMLMEAISQVQDR